ncbi:hypothetical protein GIB67_026278 [Kingdonia uniflora]|uniref:TOD1/MUCI70 glycosyltransferase-like domain-containing protein n=1 Tax=Kingdonia uniflora TaxID=39325 RepID=A0A7J7L9V7_9MAGN|nr:hypothetical protein GIB67_026278 [Kingdonia uniflora]
MAQYRQTCSTTPASDLVSLGVRFPNKRATRRSAFARSDKNNTCKISIGVIVVILSLVLVVTVFAYFYVSRDTDLDNTNGSNDDFKNNLDFLANVTRIKNSRVLEFGQGSVVHGRDSRYWDRDDRRRDVEYNESVSKLADVDKNPVKEKSGGRHSPLENNPGKSNGNQKSDKSVGLYNEAGRDELKLYEAEYEASLKNVEKLKQLTSNENDKQSNDWHSGLQNEEVDFVDEYDDGIDSLDARVSENYIEDLSDARKDQQDGVKSVSTLEAETRDPNFDGDPNNSADESKTDARHAGVTSAQSAKRRLEGRKKPKHRPSCEMKFVDSTAQLIEPFESRKFSRFSLQYTKMEEKPIGEEQWVPKFAGHQSLQERQESFYARDEKINCGFVKGPKGSPSTGFDVAEDDERFMSSCHIAVSSCIFGNSDNLKTPTGKTVTRLSRKNVCFVMFMDENTLQTLSSEGQKPDTMGFIGLWKIVVVKNLPYTDMRRVGKIPKLLTHRLFPSARYSIWLDSKLRLQKDPLLILEYFLWRKGQEYAISNHYDRHCLWDEVAQNKKLNKFNHTIIDQQFAFYQADGLKRFNSSDPNKILPSNVPEGSFIVRAHTPMSNLFSCLWFNEVERFTPRDQLSFAYTYLKLRRMNPGKPFHLNMFKDCERRAIAKLYRHRSEEKRNISLQAAG